MYLDSAFETHFRKLNHHHLRKLKSHHTLSHYKRTQILRVCRYHPRFEFCKGLLKARTNFYRRVRLRFTKYAESKAKAVCRRKSQSAFCKALKNPPKTHRLRFLMRIFRFPIHRFRIFRIPFHRYRIIHRFRIFG